ncbi:MAG: sialate O-acetylesterase [Planctomycetota bacterium]
MRRETLSCAAALPVTLTAMVSPTQAEVIDLFLLAGQSNMTGGASINGLPSAYLTPRQDVNYSWRMQTGAGTNESNGFGPLEHLKGQAVGSTFGPEMGFGHTLADAMPDRNFALAKFSTNGSNLDSRWGPDDDNLYPEMIDFARRQIAGLESLGYTVNLEGFVWVQGSGDAYEFRARNYADNMTDFIAAIRDDLGVADLPVFMTQEHADSQRPAVDLLRDQKQLFVDSDPLAWMVNIDDAALRDAVHFSTDATVLAGQRLAQSYLNVPAPQALPAMLALIGLTTSRRRTRPASLTAWTTAPRKSSVGFTPHPSRCCRPAR